MKIKYFNISELPVLDWSDGCGTSQEIFCWPVASDYSLRASIATVAHNSVLKQYPEGERLAILLDSNPVCLTDATSFKHQLKQAGDMVQLPAYQQTQIQIKQSPTHLMNFIFRADRWEANSYLVSETQKLPANQAGLVYVLSGEWALSGGNSHLLLAGEGGWWLPDIGEGQLKPRSAEGKLLWIRVLPS